MRSVTFVDRLTLEVEGTVAQNGICLGDISGDGNHELIVGNEAGELFIFKGSRVMPWLRCTDLGFITAIGVGDLLGLGHSVLVVASGCGWLNIFDLSEELAPLEGEPPRHILPIHTQRVPANVKDLILCDVTGKGVIELVVSLTDRVVRTYRWQSGAGDEGTGRLVSVNKWEFASQIGTVTCNIDGDGIPSLLVAQPGGAFMKLRCKPEQPDAEAQHIESGGEVSHCAESEKKGKQNGKECEKENELNSENETSKENGGERGHEGKRENEGDGETQKAVGEGEHEDDGELEVKKLTEMSVEYEPLGVNRRRNRNVSAEILGGFESKESGPGTRYAIVTLDGTVLLVDHGTKDPMDSIMWNLQVDHQLMCLSKLDVTGDGLQEVIACSWDGQTYIISQDRQAVRFQFEESVSTFTAGLYSLKEGSTVPALVYVTFSGTIQVYYNLGLERGITLSSLVHCPGMVEEASDLLEKLGVDATDMRQLQQVYNYCLYGIPSHMRGAGVKSEPEVTMEE